MDVRLLAATFHDRGGFLVDRHALRPAKVFQANALQLDAKVFGDATPASQDCDVFHHRLPTIAKARSLDRRHLEGSAKLVHHESRQGFAFNVFRNNQERFARLDDLLQQGKQILQVADLLLENQNVRVLKDRLHRLRVRHEVRREIALVELHAFHHVKGRLNRLRLFHGDRAVLTHFVHRVSDNLADRRIPVGRNGRNLGDFCPVLDLLRNPRNLRDQRFNRLVNPALQRGRVRTSRDILQAFLKDRLRQNGRRSRAIARHVARLARHFANQLRSHILIGIFKLDLFRHRHTVFGDRRTAELLVKNDVPARWPKGGLHGLSEFLDPAQKRVPGGLVELELFSCHSFSLVYFYEVLTRPKATAR